MANTRCSKIEFGNRAVVEAKKICHVDSRGHVIRGTTVKIVQKNSMLSGTRKLNVSEQRRKESYQKINRMLGGAR